jgi:ribonuclease D
MSEGFIEKETEPESIPLVKSRTKYFLVDSDSLLESVIADTLETTEPLAVDAERASGFRYGQKAYLVQVGIRNKAIYLVDPVAKYSPELWKAFVEAISSKTWIIHAASQDIPCLAEIGIKPKQILDTELGTRILGLPRVSLGTITEHYLLLKLAKEHSAVDWSERPLRQEWLEYAALDVDVLHELWAAVSKDLQTQDKFSIASEEFAALINQPTKPVKQDRWRSLTGLHEIKDVRSLTIAKTMWEAREELAINKDIAPGRLVPDLSIVAAVKAMPKSKSELASLKTFSGRASRTYIDVWWEAFTLGNTTKNVVELRLKATGIPNHRNWPLKFPDANARLLASKAAIAELSENKQIPSENILSPDILRSICFEPPSLLDTNQIAYYLRAKNAREWQIDLLLPLLVKSLTAQAAVVTESLDPSE